MPIDTAAPRSRRALLGAAAGAAAATFASAVARPLTAQAAEQGISYINDQSPTAVITAWSVSQDGFPNSGKGVAVLANSELGPGVLGRTQEKAAVSGFCFKELMTFASPPDSAGVYGYSDHDDSRGVYGHVLHETAKAGVMGYSNAATGSTPGVLGVADSPSGIGVRGQAATGVLGSSTAGHGVRGTSSSGLGVFGDSDSGTGVKGRSKGSGAGLLGESLGTDGTGVKGSAALGRGAQFSGGHAQIRLIPSANASHPAAGQAGDLFLDASLRLWLCKGSTTWARLDL